MRVARLTILIFLSSFGNLLALDISDCYVLESEQTCRSSKEITMQICREEVNNKFSTFLTRSKEFKCIEKASGASCSSWKKIFLSCVKQ